MNLVSGNTKAVLLMCCCCSLAYGIALLAHIAQEATAQSALRSSQRREANHLLIITLLTSGANTERQAALNIVRRGLLGLADASDVDISTIMPDGFRWSGY